MSKEKADRSQEIWLFLLAGILGVTVTMASITYWGYNLFEGIVFGFLVALPFGIVSRLTHHHREKIVKALKAFQKETRAWLRIFFRPSEPFEQPEPADKRPVEVSKSPDRTIIKLLILTVLIYIVTASLLITISGYLTWLAFIIAIAFSTYLILYAKRVRDRKELRGRHVPSIFSISIVALPLFFGIVIAMEGAITWNSWTLAIAASGLTMTVWGNFFRIPLAVIHKYLELKEFESPLRKYPRVTIIVPAYNEETGIGDTIESLMEADYPKKEIIVVDDGSTDRTSEIAKQYTSQGVRVIRKENGGKASAINYGFLFSKGEIIIIVDADSIIERSAVREIVKKFEDPDVDAVAGNIKVLNRKNFLTKCQALEYIAGINITRRAFDVFGTITVVPGALGAFRRSVLTAGGQYDKDTLTEDFDLTIKTLKLGKVVQASSYGSAYTQAPDTLKDLYKQRMRWYRGNLQTIWKHKDALTNPRFGFLQRLSFPFMIFNMLLLPFLGLLVLATIIIIILEGGWQHIITLFLTFLTLEALTSILAIQIDNEDMKLTLYSPFFVVGYKHLRDFFLIKALFDVLFRKDLRWTSAKRTKLLEKPPSRMN